MALVSRSDRASDAPGRLELGDERRRLGLGDAEQLPDQRGVGVAILGQPVEKRDHSLRNLAWRTPR
jgi:hypothetical protein